MTHMLMDQIGGLDNQKHGKRRDKMAPYGAHNKISHGPTTQKVTDLLY